MIDYESMIFEYQEAIEIWEDEPDSIYLDGWIPDEEKENE